MEQNLLFSFSSWHPIVAPLTDNDEVERLDVDWLISRNATRLAAEKDLVLALYVTGRRIFRRTAAVAPTTHPNEESVVDE